MNNQSNCENCSFHHKENLVRLGVAMNKADYVVAVAGNPNTGKSTVFNNLTGLRQHTGNWPGKTVTRAEGGFSYGGKFYKLVDLPGTYSLLSTSSEEEVARNFILFGKPDVTVIVADATRLERNLNLVLQILEITDRAVLCLNLMDEAKRNNINIDVRSLSKELGIPVIATNARQKTGMSELITTIEEIATGRFICRPHRIKSRSAKLNGAITILSEKLAQFFPGLPNLNWVALRLLEGDQRIIEAVETRELEKLGAELSTN
ncbi:FeoB small GTPase domain-containing protein [Flavihumibacter profundi]|jgi:Fe2+ transport system protein B|uniref:FeoB small GTPase domain-containing protein n=1 Tax=Flavihumibacter profundi TaxID=2716883 RepID=UPI001CC5CA5C|nr:FeoB small GTPase domain-containing protein [Flavihumibacter profundi]MBZ5856335.1 50S ribosome-binding GTPase [Flavihumibacter profundi]